MTEDEAFLAETLFRPLAVQFGRSQAAYRDYMQAGKTFRYARLLRDCNQQAHDLLAQHQARLPASLQDAAAELIAHYRVWMAEWDACRDRLQPGPDDAFVFSHGIRFPKDAEARLNSYYDGLET